VAQEIAMSTMKRFLISYTFHPTAGTEGDWHRHVADFIRELGADRDLGGRIRYRCMKAKEGASYFHLAEVADEEAVRVLNGRPYFKAYTEETKRVGGGAVTVTPLDVIAETERA
jgi:hypothetical protein